LGCGRIASDFINALKSADGAELAACAARSTSSAESFASTHGVNAAYGSYEELAADDNVDIVYVSTIHHLHHEHAMLCLEAGKNVLVEKPIALTHEHATELADAASERGLFLMEGMWTRFFPVVRKARALMDAGEIGEIKSIHSDFGFVLDAESRPHMVDVAQGGGGLMEIGCYPIAAALMGLGQDVTQVAAAGHVTDGGVDLSAGMTLYGTEGAMAVLTYTLHAQTPEETLIAGTKGHIRIHSPAHCPTRITLTNIGGRESSTEEMFEIPLPLPHSSARLAQGEQSASNCAAPYSMFHYPNSMGMVYEAEAVMECIREGQTECEEFTVAESLEVMRICDEVRGQLGVVWPSERSRD
jgi:dihydrodiol dehydrogenase / D-xylose 1-dehydrogenase (NADP)